MFSNREIKGRTVYFKKGKTRVEYDGSRKSTYLVYPKEKERFLLKEKLALKSTFKEVQANMAMFYGDTIAQITKETKVIAGFKCIKAVYTYPVWQKPSRTLIWFTRDIAATNDNFAFKGIDGFIMEYIFIDILYPDGEAVDFREIMTCQKVERETVSDDLLKIPSDYKVMTWDEFKKGAKVEYH